MRRLNVSLLALSAVTLTFLGCATSKPETSTGTEVGAQQNLGASPCNTVVLNCTITDEQWQHIHDRHCNGCVAGSKSAFAAAYCTDKQAGINFCTTVINHANCMVNNGPNNTLVATVADLGSVVGQDRGNACGNTQAGAVIFNKVGGQGADVLTQRPGL